MLRKPKHKCLKLIMAFDRSVMAFDVSVMAFDVSVVAFDGIHDVKSNCTTVW